MPRRPMCDSWRRWNPSSTSSRRSTASSPQRNTDVGALINAGSAAGQELFEVSDLHRVRIYVQVPQAFSADLQPGLKATFEMPQYPGQKFDATLVTTSNAMNATSRSMLVELQADNPDGKLAGGAYCQVHFQLPSDPNMVRVPATALMPANRGAQVAVLGDDNKVVLKSSPARPRFRRQRRSDGRSRAAGSGDRQPAGDIAKWRSGPVGCHHAADGVGKRSDAILLTKENWLLIARSERPQIVRVK